MVNVYCGTLALLGIFPAVVACSAPADDVSTNIIYQAYNCRANLGIPTAKPGSPYEQWHLVVAKSGHKTWNGQDLDDVTLQRYMNELSQMPASAGKLTIHLEPGTSCQIASGIQNIVKLSPLCRQYRCVRDRWDYEKPIVN